MKRRFKVSGYSGSTRLTIRLSGLSTCLACWAWTLPDIMTPNSPAKKNDETVFSDQALVFRRFGISRENLAVSLTAIRHSTHISLACFGLEQTSRNHRPCVRSRDQMGQDNVRFLPA